MYLALYLKSESCENYLFCEEIDFTQKGLQIIKDRILGTQEFIIEYKYQASKKLTKPQKTKLEDVVRSTVEELAKSFEF